ncbi:aldehyde reductase [Boseongicola sp. H5]|uniref:SDR family oxidoreductase n=1 Tax=Boseongicola sp. H5 TaxID=2763261 RepID=UPI001D09D868|nr:aldehyde reductase [Boseongicola sp. H5]
MTDATEDGPAGPLVLVTGASGFIAQHVILQLLHKGYRVRGTLRRLDKAPDLRAAFAAHTDRAAGLDFATVDLGADDGWAGAMEGVSFVQHVASPFPPNQPKDPDELIAPARDGALRALRFARAAGVKRVVLTSSMAAVAYGHGPDRPAMADETLWSNPDNLADNTAYTRSKTIAERAAWAFMDGDGGPMELATINPSAVLGPLVGRDGSASLELVTQLLTGKVPAYPDFGFEIVDVRDVAAAHLLAMERPEAAGERFLVTADYMMFREIGDVLKATLPDRARKIPSRNLPSWLFRLLATVTPAMQQVIPELGVRRRVSADKAHWMLGWSARPPAESVRDCARDLIGKGLV